MRCFSKSLWYYIYAGAGVSRSSWVKGVIDIIRYVVYIIYGCVRVSVGAAQDLGVGYVSWSHVCDGRTDRSALVSISYIIFIIIFMSVTGAHSGFF